jgi:tetratricopeptide (TPR) repeat protein
MRWSRWLCYIPLLCTLACSRQPLPALWSERLAAQELVHLGQVYQARGDQVRALQAYQQAVQMHPGYVPAWTALGDLHYVRQEYAPAEAVYKKILTLNPQQAEIYDNLCWVYLSTHRNLDAAESLIQQALALNPSPRNRYLDTQAVIWLRQGKYEQALASLDEAIGLTPSTAREALAERYQLLAEIYRRMGRDDEAQRAQEQAANTRRSGDGPMEGDL